MGILKKLFGFLFADEPEFQMPSANATFDKPATPTSFSPPATGGEPFANPIEIQYVNFQGEAKTFAGDADSLRAKGKHISVCVQPTGARIALSRKRIQNADDVNAVLEKLPDPNEARVLNYHKSRGTTSERYEELKQKYPNY